MRQFTLSVPAQRPLQPVAAKPQSSYYRDVAQDNLATICQTIASLTQPHQPQHGWILVLAPQQHLSKQLLEQCQIDCQRLLVISQKQIHRYDNLMRDALTCSTCSAVLSFLPANCPELQDYQYLAQKYQTLLINHSATQPAATH